MRKYIDADKLREIMYHEAFETDTEMQRWDSGCWIRYKMFENALEQMPSADVVEVRHGRWKNEIDIGTEMMACSVCEARVLKKPYISAVGRKGYAYCPYCGAKMDEVEE